jgi:amidohydrolase
VADLDRLERSVIDGVIRLQREIHADPEIGFDTVRTAARAAAELRKAGLAVREGIGRTGVVADLEAPGARRRIALRADMDALPMEEEADLPHRSRNPGAAHLCGHDAHTAMLVGAARALATVRDRLPCSVRFIFQPNEEALPGGAPAMIADGCLEGVDRIFGMHVWPLLDTGQVGLVAGPAMAQPDTFRIDLTGVGGHAAAPHACRDPVVAGAAIITALQTIVSRNVDPLASAVVSVTQFHAGTADNVIPERAWLGGTVRSFDAAVGERVHARVGEIARAVAAAHGCEAEVERTLGYPVLVNDPDSCDEAERAIAPAVPVTRAVTASLGGEDFAYYLREVPGAFLFLGNRDEARGIVHFCHHPRFQVDDRAMPVGVRAWLSLALHAAKSA